MSVAGAKSHGREQQAQLTSTCCELLRRGQPPVDALAHPAQMPITERIRHPRWQTRAEPPDCAALESGRTDWRTCRSSESAPLAPAGPPVCYRAGQRHLVLSSSLDSYLGCESIG